jgi:prephenate dehydrogenase
MTSVHPMFGPSARTLSGRNLLVVQCRNSHADDEVKSLFGATALSIGEVSLGDHDRIIAESLGLSHAVNLLFLQALGATSVSASELDRAASTTFHRQSSLAHAVATEGANLYLDIQARNPHSRRLYSELERSLRSLRSIVERRDVRQFRRILELGRAKLEEGPQPMRA